MQRRKKESVKLNKKKLVIVMILLFCLITVFIFGLTTRSDNNDALKLSVQFNEKDAESGISITQDVEIHQDEQGIYFLVLPEKVGNYYVKNYYVPDYSSNTVPSLGIDNGISSEDLTSEEAPTDDSFINEIVEEVTNDVMENSIASSTVRAQKRIFYSSAVLNELANNTVDNNTIVENAVSNETANDAIENNSVENNIVKIDNFVTNTIKEIDVNSDEFVKEQKGNIVENVIDNTIVDNDVQTDDVQTNFDEESVLTLKNPGDYYYFYNVDYTEFESFSIDVVYDTIDNLGNTLYKQDISGENTTDNFLLTTYAPLNSTITITNYQSTFDGLIDYARGGGGIKLPSKFNEANTLFAYNLNIVADGTNFTPISNVKVNMQSKSNYNVLDNAMSAWLVVDEGDSAISYDNSYKKVDNKTIQFEMVSLKPFGFAYLNYTQNNAIIVDDYESDKNYFLGKNYTDNYGTYNETYKEDNLAKVRINYYGYDISYQPFSEGTNIRPGATISYENGNGQYYQNKPEYGNVSQFGKLRFYLTCTPAMERAIELGEQVRILVTRNDDACGDLLIPVTEHESYWDCGDNDVADFEVTDDYYVVILKDLKNGTVSNTWSEGGTKLVTRISFLLCFSKMNIDTSKLRVYSVDTSLPPPDPGYISDTERQTCVSYLKCVPVDANNKINLELIDNPFMDRPYAKGFNGWLSTNSNNTISIDGDTYVQTLTATVTPGGDTITDIDVYVDWIDANVIYLDNNNGNDNSNGKTKNTAVKTLDTAIQLLNSTDNRVGDFTGRKASLREFNILYLMNGDFSGRASAFGGAVTITSLYEGINRINNSSLTLNQENNTTYISFGDNDVQLAYLNLKSEGNVNFGYLEGDANTSSRFLGNSRNVRIGRGIRLNTANNNRKTSFPQIIGGGTSNRTYKLVVESGRYNNIQSVGTTTSNITTTAIMVLGNDIDRVKNINNTLQVFHRTTTKTQTGIITPRTTNVSYSGATVNPYTSTKLSYLMLVKSGQFGVAVTESTDYQNEVPYTGIYIGGHGYNGADKGHRVIIVEGGQIANINGGLQITNNAANRNPRTNIYVKGGDVYNIVGGAGVSQTGGDRMIQVTGGGIRYSISGGSNGYLASGTSNGKLIGNSLVYVGGNADIGTALDNNANASLYGVPAGCVLGAGNGNYSTRNAGAGQVYSSKIIIDGDALIRNSVFGGGNYGIVQNGSTSTTSLEKTNVFTSETPKDNGIYVISSSNAIGNTNVNILRRNNNNLNTVGINNTTDISNDYKWKIIPVNGGYKIQNVANSRYIYASGNTVSLQNSQTNGTTFTINNNRVSYKVNNTTYYMRYNNNAFSFNTTNQNNASNIYFLTYEEVNSEKQLDTLVDILIKGENCRILQNVYGGANQNYISGSVNIRVENGTIEGTIYGGSNSAGTINGQVNIDVVGGNLAINDSTDDAIFGGGKGNATDVLGSAKVNVLSSEIPLNIYGNIYGGSAFGKLTSNTTVTIKDTSENADKINLNKDVYGGGKGTTGTTDDLGNNIDQDNIWIEGNSLVSVEGGSYPNSRIYGGFNASGTTNGTIDVKIGEINKTFVNEVYGGGNQAAVKIDTDHIKVLIAEKAVVLNAYNGGNQAGIEGDAEREIKVSKGVIGLATNKDYTKYGVYGGSNTSGNVSNTNVVVENEAKIYGSVYGGGYGNDAETIGRANVNVNNSKVYGTVYGGGNAGPLTKTKEDTDDQSVITAKVTISNGSKVNYVYGGGNKAEVSLSTDVLIDGSYVIHDIFGGGNQGKVKEDSQVRLKNLSQCNGNIFGGGNAATVERDTRVELENVFVNTVFGGGNQGEVKRNTTVTVNNSTIGDSIYGGGNQGKVSGTASLNITGNSKVYWYTFGGGKKADVKNTAVTLSGENVIASVAFGGGDEGNITANSSIIVNKAYIGLEKYSSEEKIDILADIDNSTLLDTYKPMTISDCNVAGSVFAGGNGTTNKSENKGRVGALAKVIIDDGAIITRDVFGGGNGNSAIVLGTSNAKILGNNTLIQGSVFGSGNRANTGESEVTSLGISRVDIAGGIIKGDVFGGGNCSQIFGKAIVNIGTDAIQNYDTNEPNYPKYTIDIEGSVYGGGNTPEDASGEFDVDFKSVTGEILINIDGNGYETLGLDITDSVFGSGNVSNATVPGTININNYGTPTDIKALISIQRAGVVTLDNSYMYFIGTTDSTVSSEFAMNKYSLSKVSHLKLKDSSTIYLANMLNEVAEYSSVYDDNGVEKNVAVTINGNRATRDADNRIYINKGINMNVSPFTNVSAGFGAVHGMTFFGIYKDAYDENNKKIFYSGMYAKSYENNIGRDLDWEERDFIRSYVAALPVEDYNVDGFYTVFEELEYEPDPQIGIIEDEYVGHSKLAVIEPTDFDSYYIWYAGPDEDIYFYELSLIASKFSTLGTYEQALTGFMFPNAEIRYVGFDYSTLRNDISLKDKNTIPTINEDQDKANTEFALAMKNGTVGWSMSGVTDYLTEAPYATGTMNYLIENSQATPSLKFYFYSSTNVNTTEELGYVTIEMRSSYWIDELNQGSAILMFKVNLATRLINQIGYNGAITPGVEYDLFTNTLANITTKSAFSAYFQLSEKDFMDLDDVKLCYANSRRAIEVYDATYSFPAGTTITMIDKSDVENPSFYYYNVTTPTSKIYFDQFKRMGAISGVSNANDVYYDEVNVRQTYLQDVTDSDGNVNQYEYECFIFIVNFENVDFSTQTLNPTTNAYTENNTFRIVLEGTYEDDLGVTNEKLIAKLNDGQNITNLFGIYNGKSSIELDADLSEDKIYLGDDTHIHLNTIYKSGKTTSNSTVYDTKYFDKKLGVNIALYRITEDNGVEKKKMMAGADLLGSFYELNGKRFFPRNDGSTRIKLADLVSNAVSDITFNTENSSFASGKFEFVIQAFGSSDGIYYGLEADETVRIPIRIVNDLYGLDSLLPDNQVIIDKDTGTTLTDDGLLDPENNELEFELKYVSALEAPYITVHLERRDYDRNDIYGNTYTRVDLKDYVEDSLLIPVEIPEGASAASQNYLNSFKKFDNTTYIYKAFDTDEIKAQVESSGLSETDEISMKFKLHMKKNLTQGLVTGTYKVVFTLYDAYDNVLNEVKNVGTVEKPQLQITKHDMTTFAEVGNTFSYIIIKGKNEGEQEGISATP